jgi:hypothetical protein
MQKNEESLLVSSFFFISQQIIAISHAFRPYAEILLQKDDNRWPELTS